jgi:hypothetical protein
VAVAQEFPCGHFRFLPTRHKGCIICQAGKTAAKRKRERSHAQKVAGIAEAVKGTVDPFHIHVPRART